MIITTIYDKQGRCCSSLQMYEHRLQAFRDFKIQIAKRREQLPFIKDEDYSLLELGFINPIANEPVIDGFKQPYEITEDEIKEYLETHPLQFRRE